MENSISNEYIENALNDLWKYFGVKEPIFGGEIFNLVRNNKIKEAVKIIVGHLGLPIDINITYVPNDYRAQNDYVTQNINNQFHSTHLVKVNQHGIGNESIIAQVNIPGNIPFYGSPSLKGYPINVKVSENCTKHPVTFTMIMAHELSHILLYSLNHTKKENEFYTDLTAMLLGFQNIFKNGRRISKSEIEHGFFSTKVKTLTTTYGYLTGNQFYFALKKINQILKECKRKEELLRREFNKFNKLFIKYDKMLLRFSKCFEYLSKNYNKKISYSHSKRITTFFQPDYIDNLNLLRKQYKQKSELVDDFLKESFHNTEQKNDKVLNYINEIKNGNMELKKQMSSLKKDIKILKKYT